MLAIIVIGMPMMMEDHLDADGRGSAGDGRLLMAMIVGMTMINHHHDDDDDDDDDAAHDVVGGVSSSMSLPAGVAAGGL